MTIIVVGNEKGGCGKTTIAVNIAALSAAEGVDTLLVDADPGQQSSARWAARRMEAHGEACPIRCVTLTGRDISADLKDLGSRYGAIIVDTGAEDSPELRAAAIVADRLVVPVQPEMLDLWTLPTVEVMFGRARVFNPGLQAVLVINRIPYQIVETAMRDTKGWISENVPGFAQAPLVPLIGRAAHGRAIGEGLGVTEMMRRDPRAAQEMRRLYREITR
jgi:chromosome partitioning protein